MEKEPKGRDKVREQLKSMGKDPDKFLPKEPKPTNPETPVAGADSSTVKKPVEISATEKEQQEKEVTATEVAAKEKQKAEAEEKVLLEKKEEELTAEEKTKKKDVLALKATEREAQKEARIQKRIDELVGEIKTLKAEKTQDKESLTKLEKDLHELKSVKEKNPEKVKQEVYRLEKERINKYLTEDLDRPREERREMTKEELDDWCVEDLTAAQEWIADRAIRRREEKVQDSHRLEKDDSDKEVSSRAEYVVKKQQESQARVLLRHPDLDTSKKIAELKAAGKSQKEITAIVLAENKKAKLIVDILKEDSDKYMLVENGPELLAQEMERRMAKENGSAKAGETQEERENRIADEAAEAERQRQTDADSGLTPRGAGSGGGGNVGESEFEKENPALYKRHLAIWRTQFPKLTETELRSRLDKRLKERRAVGAM